MDLDPLGLEALRRGEDVPLVRGPAQRDHRRVVLDQDQVRLLLLGGDDLPHEAILQRERP